ncbi:MAG: hypothetical protein AAB550_00590 [Patescibacteria group bacterium]
MDPKKVLIGSAALVVVLGIVVGVVLSQKNKPSNTQTSQMVKSATEVGSTDTKTFRDTATGVLQKTSVGGAGTHMLIRDGGPSQTIYMVSSVIDLDEFVGKKVDVWGETQKVAKVSWFMDVGRVKIVE